MIESVLSWMLLPSVVLNLVLLTRPRVKYLKVIKQILVPVDATVERAKLFFQTLTPILEDIYQIVDEYKAKTGRPPLDHHFQIRFLIYHWIWGKDSLDASREHLNNTLELQEVLGMPCEKYHTSTLTRFLQRIGKIGLARVMAVCVRHAVSQGILQLKSLLFDTFPVYSAIQAKHFFNQARRALADLGTVLPALDWGWTDLLRQAGRGRKPAYSSLLPAFWFHQVYALPSLKMFIKHLQELPQPFYRQLLDQMIPGYQTCGNHWRRLKTDDKYQGVRWLLYCQLYGFLRQSDSVAAEALPNSWDECYGVLQTKTGSLDPGATLNHCATKNEYYFGRGGFNIVDADVELSIYVDTQSQLKVNPANLATHLQTLNDLLGDLLEGTTGYGDNEFLNNSARQVFQQVIPQIQLQDPNQLSSALRHHLKIQRVGVERDIGRKDQFYDLEHPNVRGDSRTRTWVQLGGLTQLLIALYAKLTHQDQYIRSIKFLRG